MEVIKVNEQQAVNVLSRIDQLIAAVKTEIAQADSHFMDLAFLLVEAKRGAFWTLRGLKSEHDYIESVFPQSRAQYYALIKIGRELAGYDRASLKQIGRGKCEVLARVHRASGGKLNKEWLDHAAADDRDTFRRRVRDFLDVKEKKEGKSPVTEDTFLTFRIFGDAINTVRTALDTMAKIAGSDKSQGHLLEMICANYNSQFTEDGQGHVAGKNSFILATIKGLVTQLDLTRPEEAERLIGIVAQGVEGNRATAA